jgi:hypothetical protein
VPSLFEISGTFDSSATVIGEILVALKDTLENSHHNTRACSEMEIISGYTRAFISSLPARDGI